MVSAPAVVLIHHGCQAKAVINEELKRTMERSKADFVGGTAQWHNCCCCFV